MPYSEREIRRKRFPGLTSGAGQRSKRANWNQFIHRLQFFETDFHHSDLLTLSGDSWHKSVDTHSPNIDEQVRGSLPSARFFWQPSPLESQMKVAIGTAICSAAVVVLLLAAVIAWEPKCGGFIYEFEFRSPVRHC
jgi:hypothetical protein